MPTMKARLAQEAAEDGLTLSSYVESLINDIPIINYQNNNLIGENKALRNEVNLITKRISIYENDTLKEVFKSHLDQTVTYTNKKNEKVEKKISLLTDVYEVIINSFQ